MPRDSCSEGGRKKHRPARTDGCSLPLPELITRDAARISSIAESVRILLLYAQKRPVMEKISVIRHCPDTGDGWERSKSI